MMKTKSIEALSEEPPALEGASLPFHLPQAANFIKVDPLFIYFIYSDPL